MPSLFADTLSIPPGRLTGWALPHPQSNSGPSPAAPQRGWWNWAELGLQRAALRELADDKHILDDLGITRDQALHEASQPFWR